MLLLDQEAKELITLERVLEQKIKPLREGVDKEALLNEEGVFFLEEVAMKLEISSARFKKQAGDLESQGLSPWREMVLFHLFQTWIVSMPIFNVFFRHGSFPENIRDVQPHWDANRLLSERGRFRLVDVCEKLPFTINQLRYQIRNNHNARQDFGVWREPKQRAMIVEMEIFSRWIRNIWLDPSVITRKQV